MTSDTWDLAPVEETNGNAGSEITSVLWRALSNDCESRVSVLDADARLRFANRALRTDFAKRADPLVGRTLYDVFPEEVARERHEIIRRVLATQTPVTILGAIQGMVRRAVFRYLPPLAGRPAAVICVARTLADETPDESRDEPIARHNDPGALANLTEREMELLRLIGEGLTTEQIAQRLHRSFKTVESHRAALGRKLGVTNKVELARIAIRAGLPNIRQEQARRIFFGHREPAGR